MSLEKKRVFSKLEVHADGVIFLVENDQVVETMPDGAVIVHSSVPHRAPYNPDADIENVPAVVKLHAELIWTSEVKQKFIDNKISARSRAGLDERVVQSDKPKNQTENLEYRD